MKIVKGKNKKRHREDDDGALARMRKKWQRAKDKEEGTGDRDKIRDTLKEGSNNRRILPRKGSREFYLEVWQHFNVGPTSQVVRCIGTFSDKGFPLPGTECPLCREFLKEQYKNNKKYERGSEKGKKAYFKIKEKWFPRQRYLMNVLNEENEVKVLACGEMIMGQLLEHWFEDGSKVGDFTDPSDGRWMNIKRKGQKLATKYKVIPDDETSEIDDWKAVRKQCHDLEEVAGEKMNKKTLLSIMHGEFDDDEDQGEDEDEGDDASEDESFEDDEDEEDEEEDKRSSRRKGRKVSRRARDEESDDDDDFDDEDDDDGDDADDDEDEDDQDEDDEDEEDEEDDEEDEDDDEDRERVRRRKKKKHRR